MSRVTDASGQLCEKNELRPRFGVANIVLLYVKVFRYFSRMICTQFYRYGFISAGKKISIEWPIHLTPQYIRIGDNVNIGNNARIQGISCYEGIVYSPVITIENNVSIQQNIHLTCASSVVIQKNTAIAANVTITDIDHPYENIELPPERQLITVTDVVIGEDCKIYNNVVILPGVTLGRHTVVAANSVVLDGIYPDYCVLAGSPAKIKKRYFIEMNKWINVGGQDNLL